MLKFCFCFCLRVPLLIFLKYSLHNFLFFVGPVEDVDSNVGSLLGGQVWVLGPDGLNYLVSGRSGSVS